MDLYDIKQLWQLRSKHGRGNFFKTPEALWEAACVYFKWCDEHPVYKLVSGGPRYEPGISIHKLRAYTLKGLCVYLGCGSKYFNHFEASLAGKTDEVSEEFKSIISMIHDVIYEQKFTAAASGELNASIIARELNLAFNAVTAHAPVVPKREPTTIVWGDNEIQV